MTRSRVGRRTRQILVFVHVAVSVGWMGAGAANVVLALTAGYTSNGAIRQVCYLMIDQIDWWLVIPLAFAALVSGIALSLVTPWGLTGYWWVLSKFVLTVAVIGYSTFWVGAWVEQSIAELNSGAPESSVAGFLAYGATWNIIAFLFMTWASVAKPWGKTPWSRRPGHRGVRRGRDAPAPAN